MRVYYNIKSQLELGYKKILFKYLFYIADFYVSCSFSVVDSGNLFPCFLCVSLLVKCLHYFFSCHPRLVIVQPIPQRVL